MIKLTQENLGFKYKRNTRMITIKVTKTSGAVGNEENNKGGNEENWLLRNKCIGK